MKLFLKALFIFYCSMCTLADSTRNNPICPEIKWSSIFPEMSGMKPLPGVKPMPGMKPMPPMKPFPGMDWMQPGQGSKPNKHNKGDKDCKNYCPAGTKVCSNLVVKKNGNSEQIRVTCDGKSRQYQGQGSMQSWKPNKHNNGDFEAKACQDYCPRGRDTKMCQHQSTASDINGVLTKHEYVICDGKKIKIPNRQTSNPAYSNEDCKKYCPAGTKVCSDLDVKKDGDWEQYSVMCDGVLKYTIRDREDRGR